MIYTVAFNGIDYAQVDKNQTTQQNNINLVILKVLDGKLGMVMPGSTHSFINIRKYDDAGILLGELKYKDVKILFHDRDTTGHKLSFSFSSIDRGL